MIKLPIVHFDCIHFFGDRPCKPNKELGVFCESCSYYEKDITIKEEFPVIPAADIINYSRGEKKIIIVKLDAVGDVLRTTSILPALKEVYNDCSITWITKERSYDVLKDNDMINEIYFTTDEQERVSDNIYDIAINLDSGRDSCEIMNTINAKSRYGYHSINGKPYPINDLANQWYLMGINDSVKKQNTKTYHEIIHEICGLKYENSEPYLYLPAAKINRADELKKSFKLNRYKKLILINLGGGNRWQYKKWIEEGYNELVNILSLRYPETAIGIVAGDEDMVFYAGIEDDLKKFNRANIIFFGTHNTMDDFICIVSLASEVFTSDSLCFHIATALSKYTVVIVGPTSYTELDVFGNGKVVYSDKVDCLCCYLNKCGKSVTCMNTLKAKDVSELFTAAN